MSTIDSSFDLSAHQRNIVKQEIAEIYKTFKEKNDVVKHTHISEDIAIGIDLGTTYCCVAAYHNGKVEIIPNEQSENTTPSYVCIHDDEEIEVGASAKMKAYLNPDSTIFDAKRIIGRQSNDPRLLEDKQFWPFNIINENDIPKIEVHGKSYFPQEISGFLLQYLKEYTEMHLNKKVTKAVITVPAYFTDGQRRATMDAGQFAGLEVLALLNEPTAAALAYKEKFLDLGTTRKIMVYDFGGGTFDVSILSINENNLEALCISGDSHLGGEDLDKNLMVHCAQKFKDVTGIDAFIGKDDENQHVSGNVKRNMNRLQKECEKVKKGLASRKNPTSKSQISIDSFANGKDMLVDITRDVFDNLNMHLYQKSIEIIDKALESSHLTINDIDDIVMVGGSTRILKVQEMLSEHFGKPLCNRLNPDEAVAYGAAVQAAILNCKPGLKPFDFGQIQEVTCMSYGVELEDKSMDVLIPTGTKIPASKTETYKTFKDGQTKVTIPIYQQEDASTESKISVGTFSLDGIPPGPAGTEQIDVTMNVGLNGTLTVQAVCRSTKGSKSLVVTDDRAQMPKNKKNRVLAED